LAVLLSGADGAATQQLVASFPENTTAHYPISVNDRCPHMEPNPPLSSATTSLKAARNSACIGKILSEGGRGQGRVKSGLGRKNLYVASRQPFLNRCTQRFALILLRCLILLAVVMRKR